MNIAKKKQKKRCTLLGELGVGGSLCPRQWGNLVVLCNLPHLLFTTLSFSHPWTLHQVQVPPLTADRR